MCCERNDVQTRRVRASHDGCCCCSYDGFVRSFATKAERMAGLETYRDELAKELEGVNERISELAD